MTSMPYVAGSCDRVLLALARLRELAPELAQPRKRLVSRLGGFLLTLGLSREKLGGRRHFWPACGL
jgi:hypothetical protein